MGCDPADGHRALRVIRDSGGSAAAATDDEIIQGMRLLARTEGIFGETAAGVTVAGAAKLLADGRIAPHETTVLCITGNGLKTTDALAGTVDLGPLVGTRLSEFEAVCSAAAVAG